MTTTRQAWHGVSWLGMPWPGEAITRQARQVAACHGMTRIGKAITWQASQVQPRLGKARPGNLTAVVGWPWLGATGLGLAWQPHGRQHSRHAC